MRTGLSASDKLTTQETGRRLNTLLSNLSGMAYRCQWFERVDKYDLVEEALDAFMNAVTANAPVRNAHYQQAE